MADVQVQTEKRCDDRRESEQVAERNAGGPSGEVAFKNISPFTEPSPADTQAKWVFGDGLGHAMVDREILAPSADHGGHPKDNTGQDGKKCGAGSKRMQCLIHMLGRLGGQVGFEEHALPQLVEGNCAYDHRDDITEGGCEL